MTRLNLSGKGLDGLPPPEIIDNSDFQTIRQSVVDYYLAGNDDVTEVLDSDPVGKLVDLAAYQRLLINRRVNDGVLAVLTGDAPEAELNYLAARFNVERQIVDPGDPLAIPPVPPTLEPLERFRERVQLAMDNSTAGPEDAYRFHVLNASPLVKGVAIDAPEFDYVDLDPAILAQLPTNVIVLECIHDAGLAQPMPGDVALTLLSTESDGTASAGLGNTVLTKIDDKVPMSDRPRLRGEQIIYYAVVAELEIPPGPDAETIRQAAQTAVENYVLSQHQLGRHIRLSALLHHLHQTGVENVNLTSPAADIVVAHHQAAYCTGVTITAEVVA